MKEMVELYKKKGFSEADATEILNIMINHKDFFIDHMMVQVRWGREGEERERERERERRER